MQLLEITWWELIALLGLVQSVWLLVYMTLRAGRIRYASIALIYFSFMTLGFLADFGTRYLQDLAVYPLLQDMVWYSLPVLSVLLSIQIAKVDGLPERKYLLILGLLPVAAILGWGLGSLQGDCNFVSLCNIDDRRSALGIASIILGAVSLLLLWLKRDVLDGLIKEKSFKSDRYWLILALVIMNCALMCLTLSFISHVVSVSDFLIIRDVLGCGLVYLASTSLFRIYPQTLKVTQKSSNELNVEDGHLVKKLDDLLSLQKVYQEPSYSRGDMARELGTSEAIVTRLVNAHFGKSVPQLLNEKRITDAKLLLKQTSAPVSVVSEQVGFNSVASFNRVFKESLGVSPSEYRESASEKSGRKQ